MTFWGTDLGSPAFNGEPKRKYKFTMQIGDLTEDGVLWYLKSTNKPEVEVSSGTEHKYLGHTFKFPGVVTWNTIEATLVDPITENAARKLLEKLRNSGYVFPEVPGALVTISKNKAVEALGPVVINQIDSDGNPVETWTLHNPFINKIGFGDLDYASEDLSEITLGITYDWATFSDDEGNEIFKYTTV